MSDPLTSKTVTIPNSDFVSSIVTQVANHAFPMHVREAEALIGILTDKSKKNIEDLIKTDDYNHDGKLDLGELEVALATKGPSTSGSIQPLLILHKAIGQMDPKLVDSINIGPKELDQIAQALKVKVREAAGSDLTLTQEEAMQAVKSLSADLGAGKLPFEVEAKAKATSSPTPSK